MISIVSTASSPDSFVVVVVLVVIRAVLKQSRQYTAFFYVLCIFLLVGMSECWLIILMTNFSKESLKCYSI